MIESRPFTAKEYLNLMLKRGQSYEDIVSSKTYQRLRENTPIVIQKELGEFV